MTGIGRGLPLPGGHQPMTLWASGEAALPDASLAVCASCLCTQQIWCPGVHWMQGGVGPVFSGVQVCQPQPFSCLHLQWVPTGQ